MTTQRENCKEALLERHFHTAPINKEHSENQLERVESLGKEIQRIKFEIERLFAKIRRKDRAGEASIQSP